MEYYNNGQNGYYERPDGERKRGIGGYVATAIVFFVIGCLVTVLLMTSLGGYSFDKGQSEPYVAPTPSQSLPDEPEAEVPVLTPTPTERLAPELDGETPVITDQTNPIPDIVDQVTSGVVGIINYQYDSVFRSEQVAGTGSGFIVSTEGYIVTNQHIISGASRIVIVLDDGTETDAELVGSDVKMDLAVLKIAANGLHPLKIGDSTATRVGEFVIAIGDPTGRELAGSTTFGIISATAREINIDGIVNSYLQTDAAINPGNSGGPLLNMNGEVIGITSAKTVTASYDEYGNAISAEGLGFALPINEAMEIAQQLITNGHIVRPGIGISVVTYDTESAQYYEVEPGVTIADVTKDGPAHKAGLMPGDVIIRCNGIDIGIEGQDLFVSMVGECDLGDELKIDVMRGKKEISVTMTVGDLNTLGSEKVE